MQFDLRDLRLFVATAELGNLTRAACRQHLSAAAASARIKALEAQAGLPLLQREARGVRLLPAGESFLHHARLVLLQVDGLRTDLMAYGGGLRGHLRIHANTTAVVDFLPELLPRFLKAHPRINVDLRERPNPSISKEVRDGHADVGIVAGEVEADGLASVHFSTDRLLLATARSHRFARRRAIAFGDTLEEDAVGMQEGSTLQAFLSRITEGLGRRQRLRVQLGSFDAMCRMIGAGVGIGVVPESVARRNATPMRLALVGLTDAWAVRERRILVRQGERLPDYTQDLVDMLCAQHCGAPGTQAVSTFSRSSPPPVASGSRRR
ncbi:MAG: LysR family transcriptional regulator [Xenophilus sp.]